ncbi:response regulator transcription factor [Acaryochloris marina]|uniref:Two component transcriptional regulator, LuxR family n=1 Tax=Acaryochloris marina (strain MBIC 11017) TaxID=329726 RepID=B0CDM7_ACAM1|nr:response regulator transcription factor [Acaryochloris marina]ABW28096.1 two component transcriptional regulator, LuxR family [Acaryochloris marina MBIC11017]BDM77133.1 DNA-binding response regulator [Acaryochloris marina MBIC10699]
MPLTVLIVDDEPGIRLAVTDYLEAVGYTVISAATGKQAWQLVQQYRPHLLVTDIRMPQMDGYELVKLVRQQPAFRLLPVIYLTECSQTQERIRGYKLGCDAYLAKPFNLEELAAVIRNLLDRVQIVQTEIQAVSQATPSREPVDTALINALDLTQREQQVLRLLMEGLSNAQIGEQLHLSSRTVEKYVSKLLQKTETSNRAEIVRFAMEHNLLGAIENDP